MKLPIIQAVRCAMCGKLHGINDYDYIVLWGKVIINTDAKEPLDLGTQEKPTILCQNTTCLQRQFRLIDEATFQAMQAKPRKVHEDVDVDVDDYGDYDEEL